MTLAAALAGLAARHRAGEPVLVALDLDGTLAPLRDDPAAVRVPAAAGAALDRLAAAGVPLALVSGRGLRDLVRVARVPAGTRLVGSHGGEAGAMGPDGPVLEPTVLSDVAAATLAHLTAHLAAVVGPGPSRLERKPLSVVVHTRGVAAEEAGRVAAAARAAGAAAGVDVLAGHDVVELVVVPTTKGAALDRLRTALGVAAGDLLFAGDDVTDERAFAVLDPADVTVRVGPGATAARFRVADPAAVAATLTALADAVEG